MDGSSHGHEAELSEHNINSTLSMVSQENHLMQYCPLVLRAVVK